MADATTKPTVTAAAPAPTAAPSSTPDTRPTKWWGHSLTIWGTLMTALTTVLPLLGPALGLDIKPELVRQLGEQLVAVAQAVTGLAGVIMALYGRTVAVTQLGRRHVTLQI